MTHVSLTHTRASPIFEVSGTPTTSRSSGPHAALATLTVTRAAVVFTDARCASCRHVIMLVPGLLLLEVRPLASNAEASGRGRVVRCHSRRERRCTQLNEIIEHGQR